jgi:hypothetical protein
MKKINIRRLYYHIRHRYITMNNVVMVVALLIGASWAWASIGALQRNYGLQKELDAKERQQQLVELEAQNLQYQQKYYQSAEYQELAVRERMTLGLPGEKVLILPPNTPAAKKEEARANISAETFEPPQSNPQQWLNFLFGERKN